MKYTSLFDLASEVFEKTGVSTVLIGGFAVNYHGMVRDTQDVDFLMVDEDYEEVKPLLEEAGCQEQVRNNLFARFETKNGGLMPLDLVFVDRKTFEEILKKAETAEIQGKKFKVPCLTHLLALKLHAMKQDLRRRGFRDLTDVLDLAEKNGIDVESKEFQKLCRDYAGEKVYETIQGLLKKWKS